ncbi:MAG: hydroxymethylbilane synthase, partial [Candidatus Brocadiae bacterium]|nr:hydroxymethylbilane synthase [Candidatus Brocadiia bacterium]
MRRLKIGTRGSELALWQAGYVRDALRRAHPGLEVALEVIRTRGDDVPDAGPAPTEGKGLFTGEIERALLTGGVDLAVHSLKDLPTQPVGGLALAAFPERADPADALVARDGLTLDSLPHGAQVLTGSPRRRAQLLRRRPDLKVSPVRGNVQTRLGKLDESDAHAIVLARAGLVRLGLADRVTERLDPADFVPACGQGALAVEIRGDDEEAL